MDLLLIILPMFFLVVCLCYRYIFYPAFISPLSKLPNAHFTCSISGLWILWRRYQERELNTIFKSHQKHGPIVRLGPNEVSVNCVDGGIRTIYTGGFEKSDWYSIFVNYELLITVSRYKQVLKLRQRSKHGLHEG